MNEIIYDFVTNLFATNKNANARTSHCMQYIHDSLRIQKNHYTPTPKPTYTYT